MSLSVVILAAGKGTRMRSQLPKVLHPVAGRPMLQHVLDTARTLAPSALAVVVGAGDDVRAAVAGANADAGAPSLTVDIVVQERQLGTGHAVSQAESVVAGRADTVLVLYGDTPLLTDATLRRLANAHAASDDAITLLTTHIQNPALRPNGRVVRGPDGAILGVVEAAEATPEQRDIAECNMGIYAFRDAWLWPALKQVQPSAVKGEIYLTALIHMAIAEGLGVGAVSTPDHTETLGVDTRALLAEAEAVMQRRIARQWLDRGVTLIQPHTITIDAGVDIGPDTTVYPNTCLQGRARIGVGCILGPGAVIRDAALGDGCRVEMAVVEGVTLPAATTVAPFTHLSLSKAAVEQDI
ncbi:MAG: NTP transferase domain-containing protein [Anaerolineae bacterium]